jgi:hypothetical protein
LPPGHDRTDALRLVIGLLRIGDAERALEFLEEAQSTLPIATSTPDG